MFKNDNTSRDRRRAGRQGAQWLVLLALSLLAPFAAADETGAWRLTPAIDLSTATYFEYSGHSSATYPAVGAELSVELSAPENPFSTGLFLDYELTSSAEGRYAQLGGGWASYRYGRWKLSSVAAHFKSGDMNGLWMHASKLQFSLRPEHRIAIEAIGVIGENRDLAYQLVYNTYLGERTSISLKLGLGSNRMRDFGAGAKFVWSVY